MASVRLQLLDVNGGVVRNPKCDERGVTFHYALNDGLIIPKQRVEVRGKLGVNSPFWPGAWLIDLEMVEDK